jgi:prevent-host-death family protein
MAMKRVGIAELKNNLSAHLRAVEQGGEIEVTDRDRPIARIVPVQQGTVGGRIVPARRAFADVRRRRHAPARWPLSSLELLLEERRDR